MPEAPSWGTGSILVTVRGMTDRRGCVFRALVDASFGGVLGHPHVFLRSPKDRYPDRSLPIWNSIAPACYFLPSERPVHAGCGADERRRTGKAFRSKVLPNRTNNERDLHEIACLVLLKHPAEEKALLVLVHWCGKGGGGGGGIISPVAGKRRDPNARWS